MFDLNRYIEAQKFSYSNALAELRNGKKQSHWIWYVLPQIRGLGSSAMSVQYGLSSLKEARAYLEHPILGARLKETVNTLLAHNNLSAVQILGDIDAKKFRSCLTLFIMADNNEPIFQRALNKYFSGEKDPATLQILSEQKNQN